MSTQRNVRTRIFRAELNKYRRQDLLIGPGKGIIPSGGYYGELRVNNLTATPEQHAEVLFSMKGDWQRHRDELIEFWINPETPDQPKMKWAHVQPGGPGTRPYAWWAFDAPEPLRGGETQAEYLTRLKLFKRGERARIKEPEPCNDIQTPPTPSPWKAIRRTHS